MRLDPTTPLLGATVGDFTNVMSKRVMLRVHLDECETCMAAARFWQAGDFTDNPTFCDEGAKLHRAYTDAALTLPPGATADMLLHAPPLLAAP